MTHNYSYRKKVDFVDPRIGSKNFELSNMNQFAKKIEVWSGQTNIRGIRMTFTDGSTSMVGKEEENHNGITFDYENGERITSLLIWKGSAFYIKTSTDRVFFTRGLNPLGRTTKLEVGSGILLGAFGRHGDDCIETLGFSTLRNINHVSMSAVWYDESRLSQPAHMQLKQKLSNPNQLEPRVGMRDVKHRKCNDCEWRVTQGVTNGMNVTIKARVPVLVVSNDRTTSCWKFSEILTYNPLTFSDVPAPEMALKLTAPPLTTVLCVASYFEGVAENIPFTARLTYTLDNETRFCTDVKGVYNGVSNTPIVIDNHAVSNYL